MCLGASWQKERTLADRTKWFFVKALERAASQADTKALQAPGRGRRGEVYSHVLPVSRVHRGRVAVAPQNYR